MVVAGSGAGAPVAGSGTACCWIELSGAVAVGGLTGTVPGDGAAEGNVGSDGITVGPGDIDDEFCAGLAGVAAGASGVTAAPVGTLPVGAVDVLVSAGRTIAGGGVSWAGMNAAPDVAAGPTEAAGGIIMTGEVAVGTEPVSAAEAGVVVVVVVVVVVAVAASDGT